MELKERTLDGKIVLDLAGRLDSSAAPLLAKWLENTLPTEPTGLMIGMAGVTFIDSSGLSILVQAMKRCRERGGNLVIFSLQQNVRMIFELTRLDKAFDIFPGENESLRSLS